MSFREFLDGRVLRNLALHNQTTTVNAASVTAFKHSYDKHIVGLNMEVGNRNLKDLCRSVVHPVDIISKSYW